MSKPVKPRLGPRKWTPARLLACDTRLLYGYIIEDEDVDRFADAATSPEHEWLPKDYLEKYGDYPEDMLDVERTIRKWNAVYAYILKEGRLKAHEVQLGHVHVDKCPEVFLTLATNKNRQAMRPPSKSLVDRVKKLLGTQAEPDWFVSLSAE